MIQNDFLDNLHNKTILRLLSNLTEDATKWFLTILTLLLNFNFLSIQFKRERGARRQLRIQRGTRSTERRRTSKRGRRRVDVSGLQGRRQEEGVDGATFAGRLLQRRRSRRRQERSRSRRQVGGREEEDRPEARWPHPGSG